MVITYYGASCFKVQSGETVLAFDPPSKESSFKSPRFQANAVLISSNHKDHNGWENLSLKIEGKKLIVLDGPGEYELESIYIKGIKSANQNTIYSLKFEGITLCHMGNFSEKELRPETKEAIGEIDILFIPIDTSDALDPAKAAKISSQLEPKIVIPMHYKDNKILKKFLDEFGNGAIKPVDKLTVKKKDLATEKNPSYCFRTMPLMDKIENLRQKPESYRKKVLFFSLIIIMAAVISIWIFTLSISSSEKNSQVISSSPMQVLGEDFNNLKNTIKNSFNQIKDEKSEQ